MSEGNFSSAFFGRQFQAARAQEEWHGGGDQQSGFAAPWLDDQPMPDHNAHLLAASRAGMPSLALPTLAPAPYTGSLRMRWASEGGTRSTSAHAVALAPPSSEVGSFVRRVRTTDEPLPDSARSRAFDPFGFLSRVRVAEPPDLAAYRSKVEGRDSTIDLNADSVRRLESGFLARKSTAEVLRQFAKLPKRVGKPARLAIRADDEQRLESIWNQPTGTLLIDKFNIEISPKVLQCLLPPSWLNDEVINFYMEMLNDRNRRIVQVSQTKVPKTYCFSTFFYAKLNERGYDYQGVQRWTKRKKIDIFSFDRVLMPVHINKIHWALGGIDMRKKSVTFYDSLGASFGERFAECVFKYLDDEHHDKKGGPLPDKSKWHFDTSEPPPQQENSSDCGVFTCQFGERLSLGEVFDFNQGDIDNARKKMVVQIVRGEI